MEEKVEEKKVDTTTQVKYSQKIKEWAKKTNLKYLLKSFSLVIGAVLIILCSVVNIGFDPKNFNFYKWLVNSILIIGISIFGLAIGESMSLDKQRERVGGIYQTKIKEFDVAHKKIEPIVDSLDDYLLQLQGVEQEREEIKLLRSVGIRHAEIVRDLTKEQIDNLHVDAFNYKGVDLRKLSDDQHTVALSVIQGIVKVDSIDSSYLTNPNNDVMEGSVLNRGKFIDKRIFRTKWGTRAVKIIGSLAVGLVWGAFTVQDFMDVSSAQAWTNLVSRVFALVSSFTAGWGSAVVQNKMEADKLDYKVMLLTFFFNAYYISKTFCPQSLDDIAHQEVLAANERRKEAEEKRNKEFANQVISDENGKFKAEPLKIEKKEI